MSLVKNYKILEEDYRIDDLLDFSGIIQEFKNKLDNIDTNSVISLVGGFGSGKSTMLYQLYKDEKTDNQSKWVIFDAWKYPDRKDLWEGFVLDFAKQIDEKTFKEVKNRLDGSKGKGLKSIASVTGTLLNFKYPGTGSIVDKLLQFFVGSPVKRVFEIQELLRSIVEKANKEIYIIVEDIDRSGDKGTYFLETLRNFLKENEFKKKIICIVPIGGSILDNQSIADSYAKCCDYEFNFSPYNLSFKKFIQEIFSEAYLESTPHSLEQLDYFFRTLSVNDHLPIRIIKRIIRTSLVFYKEHLDKGVELDIRIIIYFASLKCLHKSIGGHSVNGYSVITSVTPGYLFLIWVGQSTEIKDQNELERYSQANLPIYLDDTPDKARLLYNEIDYYNRPNSVSTGRGCFTLSKEYVKFSKI